MLHKILIARVVYNKIETGLKQRVCKNYSAYYTSIFLLLTCFNETKKKHVLINNSYFYITCIKILYFSNI